MKAAPRRAIFLLGCGLVTWASAGSVLIPTKEIAKATNALAKVQVLMKRMEVAKPGAILEIPEPRTDADGKYLSPYLADGSLAPWARKGLGSAAGAAGVVGGELLADEAADAAGKALGKEIPGAAALGSLFGRKASKKLTDTATVKAIGGWDYIQSTSELSFDSVMDLAVYMHAKHATLDGEYPLVVAATMGVYPRLVGAYEPALKRAYSRANVPDPPPVMPVAPDAALADANPAGNSDRTARMLTDTLTADREVDEVAATAGLMGGVVDAHTLRSSGGSGQSAAEVGALAQVAPPPDVEVLGLDARKQFSGNLKFLNRSNRVIVGGFRVGFVVRDSVTASVAAGYQFGGTHTSGASSKTAVELAGVGPETLQEITEELYQDFIADLKAAGREVVTMDEVRATEGFARLDTTEAPYVKTSKFLQDRVLAVYTPKALPLWWEHGNQIGDKSPFATGNWKALGAISVDLDAVVVAPTFLVSFAELESSGNKRGAFSGYGSGRASTEASPKICLLQSETKLLAVHFKKKIAGDMGVLALKKQVVVGEFGAEMVTLDERDNNNATRAGLMGLAQATGDQSFFAAAGAARSEQTLAVQTHPAYFKAYTVAALRGVNDAYITAFERNPAK